MTNRQICAMEDRWTSRAFHSIGLYILTNAILQIDNRLQRIWGKDLTAIMQSARTATTAAECAGRIGTYKYAESLGIQLKQMWRATLDGKTRHAHRQLDGQMVDIGKPFEIDGYELKYPGDPSAPGYLVYNCRCTVVSVDKFHDPNAPRAAKLGDLSYEDWEAGKEVNSKNKWGTYSRNVQNSVDKHVKNGIMVSDRSDSVSTRNSAIGKPNLVSAGASLSKRQTVLLNNLQNDGDSVIVSKRKCSLKDIAALSAHEGVEFALLTRKGERMVFRGNDHHVNALNGATVQQYRDDGWKWSGHTHVYGGLISSDGDQKILALFDQRQSAIYDYSGNYSIFCRK